MHNFKKINFLKVLFFTIYSMIVLPNICFGSPAITSGADEKISDQIGAFMKNSGFTPANEQSIASIVGKVIQGFLALLGIIFVVLIVIAGNKWMNARGEEQKVEEAQDTIRRAIIGLIITVSAYAITYFVFSNLPG